MCQIIKIFRKQKMKCNFKSILKYLILTARLNFSIYTFRNRAEKHSNLVNINYFKLINLKKFKPIARLKIKKLFAAHLRSFHFAVY